jgi:PAS domain S-box-containing protein
MEPAIPGPGGRETPPDGDDAWTADDGTRTAGDGARAGESETLTGGSDAQAGGIGVRRSRDEPTLTEALEALGRERARHEAIAELGLASLRGATDRQGLVDQALEHVRELLPCDHAAVLDVTDDHLRVASATAPAAIGRQLPRAGSLADLAIRSGGPALSNDLADDARLQIDPRIPQGGSLAGWSVPMSLDGATQALSCVAEQPWTDRVESEAFLQAIANVLVADASKRAAEAAARADEERFRRLAENVPDAIFHLRLHPAPRLDYISPRYAELSGFPLEELEQDPDAWRRAVPPEDAAALDTILDFRGGDVVATAPYRIVQRDRSVRWVETRAAPLRDDEGRVTALVGATRDITALQETEEALRRALEREQRATVELREIGELKNALLAAVSHELRTPLTSVVGFAELLARHDAELNAERRRQLLASLSRNAIRLERLLGDLLDLDRLDRSMVEPVRRPTAVAELIARAVSRLDDARRAIQLELEPVEAAIDAPKVERIVENLLVNALKHTDEDSSVWVRLERTSEGVLIVVEDEGPGVPDELKTAVFDAFVRGHGAHGNHAPGTGIGLSLVARFAELHGGRAWITDREGGGAAFHVTLPDGPPAARR